MENDYKVIPLINDTWQVVTINVIKTDGDQFDVYENEVHHQGNLSDCEAWIRLTNGGYM